MRNTEFLSGHLWYKNQALYFTFIVFIMISAFYSQSGFTQVSINTTGALPASSAGLDIHFPDKGLLIPRVNLLKTLDSITVPSPAISLMVYNQNTSGSGSTAVTPGYYYWNGSSWQRFGTGPLNFWSLTGNYGTDPAMNFIGTADSTILKFRVNNKVSGIIDPSNYHPVTGFGYQALWGVAGKGNAAFGFKALSGDTVGYENTAVGTMSQSINKQGNENVSLGAGSLGIFTNGFDNTAIGSYAMGFTPGGNLNTIIGMYAGKGITGDNNVAVGSNSFGWTGGMNNTILGSNASQDPGSGNYNIILGAQSEIETGGDNNILIGSSIKLEPGNNQLDIGNIIYGNNIDGFGTSVSSGNIGIGTKNPLSRLHIVPSGGINPLRIERLPVSGKDTVLVIGPDATVSKRKGYFGGDNWLLKGNSGTDPNLNFLGTTDSTTLIFRINNKVSGIIEPGSHADAGFGYKVLSGISAGFNTATGYEALSADSVQYGNTAVGSFSQIRNNHGSGNSSLGMYAMEGLQTGNDNTAIGWHAMFASTGGSRNTMVGMMTGAYTTGSNNAAVGDNALQWSAGSNNSILGSHAANDPGLTGNNNILIGYHTDCGPSNNIVIGYETQTGSGSNKLDIGNLIYGNNIDGTYGTISSGNIGIGTDNPLSRLHIVPAGTDPLRIEQVPVGSYDTVLVISPSGVVSKRLGNFGGGAGSWSLTGNSSTDPFNNFIGTLDSKDLVVKTNNVERMRVLSTGEVHIGGGTDFTKVETDGTIEFDGNATVWNEVCLPGLTGKPASVSPSLLKFRDDGSGSTGVWLYQYQHSPGTEESLFFTFEMPHDYNEGSSIDPHVHWAPMTSDNGSVCWSMEYTWIDNNGTFSTTSTQTATGVANGQFKSTMTSLGTILPAGNQKHIYSTLVVRLYRNLPAGTDTFPAKAALISFDIAYEANTVGSRTETSK